jgi:hypothetical protein
MDSLLNMSFLFEQINFKNVWNTTDNISKYGHLNEKYPSGQ